ncbi:DUF4294 domain-containing protein [Desertivirga arenae]|uniref:DUF4294 domain-containing protein n=1 Tax=Desertivirga arenae TaxID=2810309 RepID=UPI001A95A68E|nr:DUF4294 domain-containing protein [Pedobacter sp. SYSU D00823]
MKKNLLLTVFSLFLTFSLYAQFDPKAKGENDTIRVAITRTDNGEVMPWIVLREVPIRAFRTYPSAEARMQFNRLRYNVLKVMPYAVFARERYRRLNEQLAVTPNKREQRRLVKACEKEIKDMFNREVKNMSISQGEILIKLIDRETGRTTYELVKDLKGGLTAFFYQSVGSVFGHNLKQRYDPQQEMQIESILQSSGYYGIPTARL